MAFVYWIHLPEHTDMLTEGYIGFTGKTVCERFKKHVEDTYAKTRRNYKLHNCIRKYGQDVMVVDTIVEGSEDYCLYIENKMRPREEIGLNHNSGGIKPCGRKTKPSKAEVASSTAKSRVTLSSLTAQEKLARRGKLSAALKASEKVQIQAAKLKELNTGKVHTDAHKRKVSEALVGREFSDAHKDNIRESKVGTYHSDATKAKISESKINNKQMAWEHPMANSLIWRNSETLYNCYIDNEKCSYKILGRLTGFGLGLYILVKNFKSGWNPFTDLKFQGWLRQETKGMEIA